MSKQRYFQLLTLTIAIFLIFPLVAQTSLKTADTTDEKRSDILTIDIPSSPDHKDMPAVNFLHDLHTKAVEGECSKCHDQKDGNTIFKFKRVKDVKDQAFMDLYHDNCIKCHEDVKKSGKKSGPQEAECRTCHNAKSNLTSSWNELAFDRSLHFRHENSKAIPSSIKTEETNCNVCHHKYNKKTEAIFYQKGEEESCIYCHRDVVKDDTRALRNASHDSCVACHLTLKEKKTEAGPVNCIGCHDITEQSKIKTVKDVPRLKRNQPDTVLITGWTPLENDLEKNKKTISSHMNPVAFDHKSHEQKNQSCKVCHHETLKKCNSCHTETGDEKGDFIKIGQAMHIADSTKSCIGCHNEKKQAKECAGCHFQMPEKALKDNSCISCHKVDAKSVAVEQMKNDIDKADIAKAAIAKDIQGYSKVVENEIPETVIIKTLAKEYKPSKFPHRMMVKSIFKKAGESNMAKVFHTNEQNLCMGCHHNSPASLTPPQCASCHGKTPDLETGKPGLKGAYHGQCITCHQKMEVKTVLATDCIKCHEKNN
ncbi:MAG: cytochrome c3 family protein [Desulfobacteraceae bacterium]|nr:cytochrome c3 family protein [Desulfobacteraceae bacterium]